MSAPDLAATEADLFEPGRNCWRIERASRATLIVDAADYFRQARAAMMAAQRQILMIGWDFDTRITLLQEKAKDGAPEELGPFLSWLARKRPGLDIHILKWDFGALKLLGRGTTLFRLIRWALHPRIHFRLDGAHPPTASQHHKIVVIDDAIAFCGGIDMTGSRWDTRAHKDHDPRRRRPTTRRRYPPWHDATMAMEGEAARALGDLGRIRWHAACGETLAAPVAEGKVWPNQLAADFRDVKVAIARTHGEHAEEPEVREIEALFLDSIRQARRFVYAENQYFASRAVGEAIAERVAEPDGPELVLINPRSAEGWLEEEVMGSARALLMRKVAQADRHRRFRIYTPVTEGGEDIYVHAKVMIVDDRLLRVGSANLNNRSLGLDSECDVAIDARAQPGETERAIAGIRCALLAEHLGTTPAAVAAAMRETESLVGAIELLRGPGRSLMPFTPEPANGVEVKLADSELLDPEASGAAFEPSRPGLLGRLFRR